MVMMFVLHSYQFTSCCKRVIMFHSWSTCCFSGYHHNHEALIGMHLGPFGHLDTVVNTADNLWQCFYHNVSQLMDLRYSPINEGCEFEPHLRHPHCKFLYWYQEFLCPVEPLYFSDEKSISVEK